MSSIQQLVAKVGNLANALFPHARDGKVEDVLSGLSFEAREGIALKIDPIVGSLSGFGPQAALPAANEISLFRLTGHEDGLHISGVISPTRKDELVASLKLQVETEGKVTHLPVRTLDSE